MKTRAAKKHSSPPPAPPPPGNDTEQRLLDEALTLFAEKGYDATSVREIIAATGMTRPVLYYYCKNKEDLFRRLVHATHAEAYRELEAVVEDRERPIRERLRQVMRGTFAFSVRDPRVPRLMFQVYYGPETPGVAELVAQLSSTRFGLIAQLMKQGLTRGELRGPTSDALAMVFCCLMDQHVGALSRRKDVAQLLTRQAADWLVDVFLQGVGAD